MSHPGEDSEDDDFSMKPSSPPQIEVAGPTVGIMPSAQSLTPAPRSQSPIHPAGGPQVPWSVAAYGTPFTPTAPRGVGHPLIPGLPGLSWQQHHIAGAHMAAGGRYHPHPTALGLGATAAAGAAASPPPSTYHPGGAPSPHPQAAHQPRPGPPSSDTPKTSILSPTNRKQSGGASGATDEVGPGEVQQQSRGTAGECVDVDASPTSGPGPSTPPQPIRDKPPEYDDWPLHALRGDFRRRAESNKTAGYRYGYGDDDVNTSISNTKRPAFIKQLRSRDAWVESEGGEPEWKMSPKCTPIHKRQAREAKEKEKADVARVKAKQHALRAPDAARLVAVIFSEVHYVDVCNSEQPSKDRNVDDKKEHGGKGPLWKRIGVDFATPGWDSNGVKLANPVSHEGETQEGVPQMWERLKAIDYEAPAEKWKDIWTIKEGEKKGKLDEDAAGVRAHGWWKDLRKDFRLVRKNEDQSGEHADHSWNFCGNKLVNMLMLDWFDIRGGVGANPACQQYFEIELAEESGAAFNTLTEDRDGSDGSNSDGGTEGGSSTRNRKSKDAKGTARTKDSPIDDALEAHMGKFAAIGDSMVSAMNKSAASMGAVGATMGATAGPTRVELLGDLDKAQDHLTRAEEKLDAAKDDVMCPAKKLKRLEGAVEVAEEVYDEVMESLKKSKKPREEG